jgi:hypothetical protein
MLFVLFATETRKHRSFILHNNVLTCFVTFFNNFSMFCQDVSEIKDFKLSFFRVSVLLWQLNNLIIHLLIPPGGFANAILHNVSG